MILREVIFNRYEFSLFLIVALAMFMRCSKHSIFESVHVDQEKTIEKKIKRGWSTDTALIHRGNRFSGNKLYTHNTKVHFFILPYSSPSLRLYLLTVLIS